MYRIDSEQENIIRPLILDSVSPSRRRTAPAIPLRWYQIGSLFTAQRECARLPKQFGIGNKIAEITPNANRTENNKFRSNFPVLDFWRLYHIGIAVVRSHVSRRPTVAYLLWRNGAWLYKIVLTTRSLQPRYKLIHVSAYSIVMRAAWKNWIM